MMTKAQLLKAINCYQIYTNDFINISTDDLNCIYVMMAKSDMADDELIRLFNSLKK